MRLNNQIIKMESAKFDFLLKYCERDQLALNIEVNDLISLPWDDVKINLPECFKENDFEKIIMIVAGISRSKASRYTLQQALPFVFFIHDDLIEIRELEETFLSSPPDIKLKRAGVDKLEELGEINVIDYLADGDVMKWESVKKLRYSTVFDKLRKEKIENDISKELDRINKAKAKKRR